MDGFRLDGRVAVVTGALGLLGRQHAAALAAAGAHVVVTDLADPERLAVFAQELEREFGVAALGVRADVTDASSLDALSSALGARFGRIDVLVNNAAIDDKFVPGELENGRFETYPVDRFRRQLDVNVIGLFLCCQKLGSKMAEAGRGSIINVASTYAVTAPQQALYRGADGTQRFFKGPAYPTSKAAVLQFTRYLAAYWGDRGVRVNALSPGGVHAGQDDEFVERYSARTPLGRMADRGEYRGAVVFLASDASSYMTAANLVVDGGWTAW
jgi:NAD(P)-dependent dehydrogenase (short-subunit alcohol dehydrogenase family)